MRRLRLVGLLTLVALLGLTAFLSASPARGEADAFTIGTTDFALAFVNSAEANSSAARIQRGVNAGAKLDRFPLYWSNIEPQPAQWNWSSQDAALRANQAQGMGTLAILLGVPGAYWPQSDGPTVQQQHQLMPTVGGGPLRRAGDVGVQSDCTGPRAPVGLYEPIFAGGDDPATGGSVNPNNPWARFVEQAVQRYRPGGTENLNVRYWEIWNEQDLCQFWQGSASEYARLLKVAYLVIKRVDPQATVMWGGLAHYEKPNFLYEMLNAIRSDPMAAAHNGFFDAAASHHYSTVTLGYTFTYKIRSALNGTPWQGKPIWITESGVPVCDGWPGPGCPSPYRASPQEQASYIWQNIAYTRIAGGGPIFHFQLHDDCGNTVTPVPPGDGFGLITNEPGSFCTPHIAEPRLSYTAYQLATTYFPGTELLWADIQDGLVRRVAFYDPVLKERRLLVWAIAGSDAVGRIPAAGNSARLISLNGSEDPLTPVNNEYRIPVTRATNQNQPGSATYTIGGVPYLLVEKDILPPVTAMTELQPISPPTFEVKWSASDLGSGLTNVSIWYRRAEEGWQLWLNNQPAVGSAMFTGTERTRYQFAVMASDRAGNSTPTQVAQAETLVSTEVVYVRASGKLYSMTGAPAAWAHIRIGNSSTFADAQGNFSLSVPTGRWDVSVANQVLRHGSLFLTNVTFDLFVPSPANPVGNGQFQAGLTGWTLGGRSPVSTEVLGNSHDYAVRLATAYEPDPGIPQGSNSTISQRVNVPAGDPWLALNIRVESTEPSAGTDKVEIIIAEDGQPARYLDDVPQTHTDWTYYYADLSDYAGKSVTLIFNVYQSSPERPTSALIDLVTIGNAPVYTEPSYLFIPLVDR